MTEALGLGRCEGRSAFRSHAWFLHGTEALNTNLDPNPDHRPTSRRLVLSPPTTGLLSAMTLAIAIIIAITLDMAISMTHAGTSAAAVAAAAAAAHFPYG